MRLSPQRCHGAASVLSDWRSLRATAVRRPVLVQSPILSPSSPGVLAKLEPLHLEAPEPIVPVPPEDLTPILPVTEAQVRAEMCSMDTRRAAGPDCMAVRWLLLLPTTDLFADIGVSGLSSLTKIVAMLAAGDIPESIVPFISAAGLVAVDKGGARPDPSRLATCCEG